MEGIIEKFREYKKGRKIIEAEERKMVDLSFKGKEQQKKRRLAIVVPFRDNKHQNRAGQLKKFVPEMLRFLEAGVKKLGLVGKREYKIIVVEQSDDGMDFNRGQLLNVGFNLAKGAGFDYVVYHDVDLLSKKGLGAEWYLWYPEKPVHIGGGWKDKYSYYTFVGGAFSISVADNEKVGGFPNNFWGWGGEDDAFYNRMSAAGLVFIRPVDEFLQEMYHKPTDKIPELAMEKREKMEKVMENAAAGKAGWKKNGVESLKGVKVNKRRVLKASAAKPNGKVEKKNSKKMEASYGDAVLVNVTLDPVGVKN